MRVRIPSPVLKGDMIAGMRYPHCDQRILHAPSECEYCDMYPEWQELRKGWGIAFTGHAPVNGEIACPADVAVLMGDRGDYNQWPGNTPGGYR